MGSVLIIEDEALTREGLALVLETAGFLPLQASSTRQAVELVKAGEKPTAIVADFRLRDGDTGIAAVAAIRELFGEELPTVIISGDTAPDRRQQVSASGLCFLHKPVAPEVLIAVLNEMVPPPTGASSGSISSPRA